MGASRAATAVRSSSGVVGGPKARRSVPRWKEKGGNGKVAARRRGPRRAGAKTTLMALMEGVACGLGDNSVNFWSCGLRLGHLAAEIPHREGVYRAGTRAAAGAV